MYVFGLQPKIRSDISTWLDDLDFIIQYFNNKQKEEQHKTKAKNVLAILFQKNAHTGCFEKHNFGSKCWAFMADSGDSRGYAK
jgi:hypothetical protein